MRIYFLLRIKWNDEKFAFYVFLNVYEYKFAKGAAAMVWLTECHEVLYDTLERPYNEYFNDS